MAYDATKKVTLGQLASTTGAIKSYVDKEIANLPVEQFLDQAKTSFVYDFKFNAETYSGANNPQLEGKAVLVLAVKGVDGSLKYSFVDLSQLIDVNKIDKVSGATANNLPKLNADGTLADSGTALADVITTADIAADSDVTQMLKDQGITEA